ncbi:mavicyanin-like [Sesamum indicum]|uniref:Mavicyanin-like n=1 Tax=Sesamum indicum TaxID=4182 RepID=A0A8M8VA62_SESIN|nr:mavicyanin-like [Sesamum indicum]
MADYTKSCIVLMFLMMAFLEGSMGAVYKVGDSAGWTITGVDYEKWASAHTFKVGDTVDFKYDHQFHNVMEVSRQDFESCNSSSPILNYTTGHDSVKLTSGGHHYYLCGIPGHCAAGQKIDIFVRSPSDTCRPKISPPPHRSHASSTPFVSFKPWRRSAKLLDMFLLVAYAIFA